MTGLPRDMGDDQRKQHAKRRRAEPVEKLDWDYEVRIGDAGEQYAEDRQSTEAQNEDWLPAPNLCGPPYPRETNAVTICGPTMQAVITNAASLPARLVTAAAAIGSIAALAR